MNSWLIDAVELNVYHLEELKDFYTKFIGLQILNESQDFVSLGVDKPLLNLYKISETRRYQTTGLYHFALCVPSQKALAEILVHLIEHKVAITGAANHGYSNALYLNDLEGNGIEIYADKPESEWTILEDGQIVGVTEELDVQALLALAQAKFTGLPQGTKMGHVHLKVNQLTETQDFYEKLGLNLKYNFGHQAKFMAAGFYHHHFGFNTWSGTGLTKMKSNQLGLRQIILNLKQKELQMDEVLDPSGIPLKINFE